MPRGRFMFFMKAAHVESGAKRAHSRTLARLNTRFGTPPGFGVRALCAALVLTFSSLWMAIASEIQMTESDIIVYGGTSGGVAAAVQAARAGKKVILLEFGMHLGGMTSGGLGQTDIGNKAA